MCFIGVLRVVTKLSLSSWSLNQLRNIIGSKILHIKLDYTMRFGPTGKKKKKSSLPFSQSLDLRNCAQTEFRRKLGERGGLSQQAGLWTATCRLNAEERSALCGRHF